MSRTTRRSGRRDSAAAGAVRARIFAVSAAADIAPVLLPQAPFRGARTLFRVARKGRAALWRRVCCFSQVRRRPKGMRAASPEAFPPAFFKERAVAAFDTIYSDRPLDRRQYEVTNRQEFFF